MREVPPPSKAAYWVRLHRTDGTDVWWVCQDSATGRHVWTTVAEQATRLRLQEANRLVRNVGERGREFKDVRTVYAE